MQEPLEVTITVGTSFSIGGAFRDPDKYNPVGERSVLCDGHGIEFMLDCFDRFNTKASFFIETAQSAYFGDQPMGKIASLIGAAGQDRQLLVHPCWYYFDESGNFSQNDSCAGRDFNELREIFEKSIASFERITGNKPKVIRCGNFQVDPKVYDVLSELEIPLSSSIGFGIWKPDGKKFILHGGRSKFEDVMEVPLFTYKDKDVMGGYPDKSMEITSCSKSEIIQILKQARKEGIKNIVLLTQPFDYIKKKDDQYLEITKNRINQERLHTLCSFINEHDQDFVTVDFSSKAETWQAKEQKHAERFRIPTRFRNMRKVENFINDRFWNY